MRPVKLPRTLLSDPHRILRAYALGYLSSTTPRLLSSVQRLRRGDLTHNEKLQEVCLYLT